MDDNIYKKWMSDKFAAASQSFEIGCGDDESQGDVDASLSPKSPKGHALNSSLAGLTTRRSSMNRSSVSA